MAGFRINRVSEDIKREITAIIRELKDPRVMGKMLTVVRVEVSSDASYAKVYVSVMGSEEEKKASLEALKNATGFIKREIGARLNLRAVPHPTFVLDNSIDYGAHINDLIKKINEN